MNVSWLLNGTEVQTNESVTEASYTNISPTVGTWNITAIASNENGTGMQTWVWNVSQQVTPTPSPIPTPSPTSGPTSSPSPITKSSPAPAPTQILSSNGKPSMPFYIYGWVNYSNGTACNGPTVNINNTNTGIMWQADTNASYNFYQLMIANGTDVNASEILQFNVTSPNGNQSNITEHTVTQENITDGGLFNFNITLESPAAPVITGWYNNKTKNNSIAITINESECVYFNATADQPIDVWSWFVNGTNRSHNFDNFSYCNWTVNGTYYVEVNASNSNGTSNPINWTVTVEDITAPAKVQNLMNSTPTATAVDLWWTANGEPDLVGYKVYKSGSLLDTTTYTLYNVTGLSPNTTYEFNVSAYDDNNLEGENATVTVTTTTASYPAPAITDWYNNKTLNDSTTITINESECVFLNATADQPIDVWSWFVNGTNQSHNFDNFSYCNWTVNGTYYVDVNASNSNGTSNPINWTVTVEDITPPASVTNLDNITYAPTYINWSWTNPMDADFNHTMVYINGNREENVSSPLNYSNATELCPDTSYEIATHTVDEVGNINETWVNQTTKTEPDIQAPQWSDPKKNKTTIYQGDYVKFSANWTDEVALAGYKFAINQSGAWENSSFVPFSGTFNTSENVTQITAPAGTTVGWRFYANDTSDNRNVTDIQTFVVESAGVITPITPFMIYGRVFYENGDPCNNSIVNINNTNTNTSITWQAETNASYNFYQLILDTLNVSAGDVLKFNATDGTQFNATNHVVTQSDINKGGLFDFNLTLPTAVDTTPPASITSLYNTTYEQTYINWSWTTPGDADFNYTMVYINETWKENVSSLLNYSNATGLSPNTNNTISTHTVDTSGNVNQTWVNHSAWTAPSEDTTPPASITNLHNTTYAPTYINWSWTNPPDADFNHTIVYINGIWKENVSSPFNYSNATGLLPNTNNTISTHTVDTSGNVNLSWVNHSAWTAATSDATPPEWRSHGQNVSQIPVGGSILLYAQGKDTVALDYAILATNETGTWHNWTDKYGSPMDMQNAVNTWNWSNFTWQNSSITAGTTIGWRIWYNDTSNNWNVTDIQSFVVQSAEVITPVTPFMIYGRVFYEDGSECINPTVKITNMNSIKQWQAETNASYNFYQLVLDTTNISTGNVLEFDVTDGTGYNTTNYTVTENNISNGGIFGFNLTLPLLSPIVENVNLTPDDSSLPGVQVINPDLTTNKTVTIIANVTNSNGYANITNVTANISGPREVEYSPVFLMRVSIISVTTATYNGTFNMSNHSEAEGEYKVEVTATNNDDFTGTGSMNFTYSYGPDLIVTNILTPFYLIANVSNTINATVRNNGTTTAKKFNISLNIENDPLDLVTVSSLNASESKSVSFNWTPKHEGNYTLRVMADSEHEINESDETNNNLTRTVLVGVPDFTVHEIHISINGTEVGINDTVLDSDTVNITATIMNNGTREGNCTVEFWDVKNVSINRTYVKDNYPNFSQRGTDVLVQPDAIEMRIHFSYIYVKGEGSYVKVYDNNSNLVRSFTPTDTYYIDEWVNCSGDTVRIESYANDQWILFKIDKYEALLKNQTVSLLPHGTTKDLNANWTATTGNHTILVRAVPLVPDRDETNNQNETMVHVNASRDFSVTNISFVPQEPFVGDNVTINATIENFGNRSGNVTVDFYLDDNCESFANRSVFVNANETTNGTNYAEVVWENAEPGNHTITVVADPLNIIGEIDETNNKNETTIYVDAMDFTVTNITFNPDKTEFEFGEHVKINATVENFNRGNKSGFANISFYVNNTEKVEMINITTNFSVDVGVKSYLVVDWNTSSTGLAGDCVINVTVDPEYEIFELKESNNCMSTLIFVNGTDLAVLDIILDLGEVYYDKEQVNVTLKANITNSGAINASNFNVTFYNDSNSLIGTNESLNLGAGEPVQVWCPETWNATFDEHTIKVVIDPGNNPENNVSNNERSKTRRIELDVDFTVTNITFNPKEGQDVIINATIKNLGNRSGIVKVGFYIDNNPTAFYTTPTPVFVPANGTNYTAATWNGWLELDRNQYESILKTGELDITVEVDPDDKITELKGDNNALKKTKTITFSNLTITNITFEPENPIVGSIVNVTAGIKNNEAQPANCTVWFYEENDLSISSSTSESPTSKTLPGDALMRRFHFNSMDLHHQFTPASLEVFIDGQPLESYSRDGEYHDFWTKWMQGSKIEIEWQGDCTFEIDRYQTLFENQSLSLSLGAEGAEDADNFTMPWTATTPELHKLYVQTSSDTNCTVVPVNGTDLAVTSFTLNPEYNETSGYKINDIVSINATIMNLGSMNATNFTVWFNDTHIGNTTTIDVKVPISCLEANHSIPVNRTWNATPPGMHKITVEIDPRDNPENDMSNNIWSPVKVWVGYPGAPDFAVTDINFDPPEPEEGENVTINATIENFGNVSGLVNVSFYVDAIPVTKVGSTEVVNIIGAPLIENNSVWVEAGGKNYTTANWTAKPDDIHHLSANHTIIVWADPYDAQYQDELNEENNTKREWINITESLEIMNVTLDEKPVYNGTVNVPYNETVNVTAIIKNNGSKDINATVWFFTEKEIGENIRVSTGYLYDPYAYPEKNNTIKQPDARMIRVRITNLVTVNNWELKIYDGEGTLIHDLRSEEEQQRISNNGGWTDWIPGDTITIFLTAWGTSSRVELYIDRYQAFIGSVTKVINATECQPFALPWNATPTTLDLGWIDYPYSPRIVYGEEIGNCTISVWVVDNTSSKHVFINGTDLTVNFSFNKTNIMDGDQVNITAIIENQGAKNATNFTIEFWQIYEPKCEPEPGGNWRYPIGDPYSDGDELINRTNIPGLDAGEYTYINNVSWNASIQKNIRCFQLWFLWLPTEERGVTRVREWYETTAYNYTIKVEIYPLDNVEINKTNNYKEEEVHVNVSRDFSISNVNFTANNETRDRMKLVVDMNVTLNATVNVTNLANSGGNVNVSFYIDDKKGNYHRIDKKSTRFEKGNGTAYAPLEWHIANFEGVNVAGDHNLKVVADPANDIIEFNESNNVLIPIHIYARAADLTVTDVSFECLDKENGTIIQGVVVDITAKVENIGDENATNVTVRFEIGLNKSLTPNETLVELSEETFNKTIPSLNASESLDVNITSPWKTEYPGQYKITVWVDPPDQEQPWGNIAEFNEGNNSKEETLVVQGPDLVISDMWLTWLDDIELEEENGTIRLKRGEIIKINAVVKNIGVLPADNFKTAFFVDDDEQIPSPPTMSLACEGRASKSVFAVWEAVQGNHTIEVKADHDADIAETNELNNTWVKQVYACTEELSGDISWKTLGLHGQILLGDETQPYEEDKVIINATIKNSGCLPAENFTVLMFYDYSGEVFKIERLEEYGGQTTITMTIQKVSTGNHTVKVLIDPENVVPETNESDNIISETMYVKPTRDFTVTNVTVEKTNLLDADTTSITANVSNVGLRNGTTEVSFVDYENESRTYPYLFDKNILPYSHYAPVSAGESLSPYPAITLHRPGADAIQVHLEWIEAKEETLTNPEGKITVWNENGSWSHGRTRCCREKWSGEYWYCEYYVCKHYNETASWIPGDTVYISKNDYADFSLGGYTTKNEFNRTEVTLIANETVNGTENITAGWTAYTGNHTITVTIDPDDKIREIDEERDESNNTFNLSLSVNASRDPSIVELTITPQHPTTGQDVEVITIVRNNGTKTANFTVDFWADTTKDYKTNLPCIWKWGASWLSVHFKNITITGPGPCDKREEREDVWIGTMGDSLVLIEHEVVDYTGKHAYYYWTLGDVIIGSTCNNEDESCKDDWYEQVDKIRYLGLFDRVYVSQLALGESTTVNATWHNIDCSGNPTHVVTVIVDPEDEIDEMNESMSDNRMDLELVSALPDLTVSGIGCRAGKINATIENIGGDDASNVIVRFIRDVELKYPKGDNGRTHGRDSILSEDTDAMRVHVNYLYVDPNEYLEIGDKTYWNDSDGFWSDWEECDFESEKIACSIAWWWEGARFEIDKYEYGVDDDIGDLVIGQEKEYELDEDFTVVNKVYNLTVWVDPEIDTTDDIIGAIYESNEGNNKKKKMIGPDLKIENITFYNEKGNHVEADKLIVDEQHTIRVQVKNKKGEIGDNKIACRTAGKFYVGVYINDSVSNQTVPNNPEPILVDSLGPGASTFVEFTWPTPNQRGFYDVKVVADLYNDVPELNEGDDNVYEEEVKVGYPGYKAKDGYMPMFREGEGPFHGGIIYVIGGSRLSGSFRCDPTPDEDMTANFGQQVPANATVRLARLYVYPDWGCYRDAQDHKMAFLPNDTMLQVEFNGHYVNRTKPTSLTPATDRPYVDIPDAANFNVSYATYCYDVTTNYNKSIINNRATAERRNCGIYGFGIEGMALLIVYGDEDAPLIRYWIAEDRDVMMAKNKHPDFDTGFEYEECTRKVEFKGVSNSNLANATFKTVLVSYAPYSKSLLYGEESDALYFNNREVDIPIIKLGTGHWSYSGVHIALTTGYNDAEGEGWEYVDEYITDGDMIAGIQSRGTMMCAAHAILKLTFLPDLVPSLDKAPSKVVIGNSYNIPVVINNIGKSGSRARDFSVRFYVDEELIEKKEHVEVEESTTVYFPWTAPSAVGVVEFKVVVDPDNDVEELINKQHPYGELNNNATKPVSVGLGEPIPPKHPGGGGGGTVEGWGEGTGPGEGAGEGAGAGTGGGGEGAIGETGSEAITGWLMKGTVASSEEGGGGGKGEFSMLALLMRLAMLAAAVSLVCVGYLLEKRRHNNKLSFKKKV